MQPKNTSYQKADALKKEIMYVRIAHNKHEPKDGIWKTNLYSRLANRILLLTLRIYDILHDLQTLYHIDFELYVMLNSVPYLMVTVYLRFRSYL